VRYADNGEEKDKSAQRIPRSMTIAEETIFQVSCLGTSHGRIEIMLKSSTNRKTLIHHSSPPSRQLERKPDRL
jgi:hypothetical protein